MSERLLKIVLLIYISSSCSFILQAQSRYGKLLDSNFLHILSSKKGVLYSGIDNFIEINPPDSIKNSILYFSANNGIMLKDEQNYLVIPKRSGKIRIMAYLINGNDTLIYGHRYLNVERVPEPKLKINQLILDEKGYLLKSELLKCDSLEIIFDPDIIGSETWYKVQSFTIGYSYGSFYKSYFNNGNIPSSRTRRIISRISPGKKIVIRTKAEGEGNVVMDLPIYRLTIY